MIGHRFLFQGVPLIFTVLHIFKNREETENS